MLRFCQNTRLAFLGRNTPTPLISGIFAKVDATILEALCQKGTTDAHGEWTAVTPKANSAISAFYAASVSLCKTQAIARETQMPHRTQKWHYLRWE